MKKGYVVVDFGMNMIAVNKSKTIENVDGFIVNSSENLLKIYCNSKIVVIYRWNTIRGVEFHEYPEKPINTNYFKT